VYNRKDLHDRNGGTANAAFFYFTCKFSPVAEHEYGDIFFSSYFLSFLSSGGVNNYWIMPKVIGFSLNSLQFQAVMVLIFK